MTLRRLDHFEWEKLRPIFEREFNEAMPHAPTSAVVVAEEGCEIVGVLAARLILHTEPLWVAKGYESAMLVPKLISKLHEILPDIQYAFATTKKPKVGRFLERLGFKRQEYTTYRWVKGEN